MKTSSLCALFAACLVLPAFGFEPDVIIDTHDNPANVELYPAASWTNETSVASAFRGASKVRNNSVATDFARFYTVLPTEGPWQVFIWSNGGTTSSGSAAVTHAAATTNVSYSQSTTSAQWILLGTYWFNTTAPAEVRISGAATKLSADAVRFSPSTADVALESFAATGVTLAPGGAWVSAGSVAGSQQSLHRTSTNNAMATFQPVIPTPGEYEISLWLPPSTGSWLPAGGTAASSFTVDVYARDGVMTSHTVTMPGTGANEGRWVQIGPGSFFLAATPPSGQPNPNPAKVVIKSGTTGGTYVPADAVRWSKASSYEVYMDNESATVLGTWETNSAPSALPWGKMNLARYGATYRAVSNVPNGTEHSVTYIPYIGELGYYDVYLFYPIYNPDYFYFSHYATSLTVRTATANWGSADVSRVVNQQINTGFWTHVGKYILYPTSDPDSSKRPWVKITAPPLTQKVIADGLLVLRDDEDRDSDGDSLPDWYEVLLATSTSTVDLNGDGIPDGWDTDNDGMSDGDEYRLGRNPLMTAANGSSVMSLQVHTPTFR